VVGMKACVKAALRLGFADRPQAHAARRAAGDQPKAYNPIKLKLVGIGIGKGDTRYDTDTSQWPRPPTSIMLY
jgi:hypothetical protein